MADGDERERKKKRPAEDDEGSRPGKKREDKREDPPGPTSSQTSSEAPDEASSVESGDAVKDKRRWTLSEVVGALRTRPRLLADGTVYINEKILKALGKAGA